MLVVLASTSYVRPIYAYIYYDTRSLVDATSQPRTGAQAHLVAIWATISRGK